MHCYILFTARCFRPLGLVPISILFIIIVVIIFPFQIVYNLNALATGVWFFSMGGVHFGFWGIKVFSKHFLI